MFSTQTSDAELSNICMSAAIQICAVAKLRNTGINTTIYPFRMLLPPNIFDIDDWDDAINYIAIAVYYLSIYYITKNLPVLIKSQCISK